MKKLTQRQAMFIEAYKKSGDEARAAKEAGYRAGSEGGYRGIGRKNLLKLRDYIEADALTRENGEMGACEATIAGDKEVLKYLTQMMRREHVDKVVATVSEETSTYVPDEKGTMRKQTVKRRVPTTVEIPVRLSEAMKAAELLGKKYRMWTDKGDDVMKHEVIEVNIVDDDDDDS